MQLATLQEDLSVLLCFSDKYAKVIRGSVDVGMYSGPYRQIATAVYSYLDRYGKPPKEHIADLLEVELGDATKGSIYTDIVTSIHEASANINEEYVINRLETFVKRQAFRAIAIEATNALKRDTEEGLDEAYRLFTKAQDKGLKVFDPGTRLGDKTKALAFLDISDSAYPLGIPELDKRGFGPTPKELWLFIANAKRGKCIAEGEPVLLSDGSYVPIEQVTKGSVLSLDSAHRFNEQPIFEQLSNGVKDVYRVTTTTGRQIVLTAEHPLLTLEGWKTFNEIKIGTGVAVPLELPVFGTQEIEEYKAKLLGYMIADGGMSKANTPTFTKEDPEVLADFESCVIQFGDKLVSSKTKEGHYWVSNDFKGNNTVTFLRSMNLMEKKSNQKQVPELVFRLTKPLLAKFLGSLFVCDGSVYLDRLSAPVFEYSTTSRVLGQQIQHLLTRFGICSKIRERQQLVNGKPYLSWSLSIRSRESLERFSKEIGLPFSKGRKLKEALSLERPRIGRSYLVKNRIRDVFYDKIQKVEFLGPKTVYDLSVNEIHNFVASNIVVHNSWALIHLAKMATAYRLKVVHISLEMSEARCAQRYFQAMFAIGKRKETYRATKFRKDELGRIIGLDDITINPRLTLDDPEVRTKLEGLIEKWALRQLNNIIIKQFPTGQLTVPKLKAYLDNLEQTEKFVPDILIVDYPDLMKLSKSEIRLSLDEIYKDIRGIAVERNIAVAVVSQGHRGSAKAKQVGAENVAEAYSKIAHADCVITYSQTDAENKLGLARLHVAAGRNDEDRITVVISQNYGLGAFAIDSAFMTGDYWKQLPSGEEEEE